MEKLLMYIPLFGIYWVMKAEIKSTTLAQTGANVLVAHAFQLICYAQLGIIIGHYL